MSAGWSGAVLCGGASRRMGRDKALLVVDGSPQAVRVADVLQVAGAGEVFTVGGEVAALAALGLDARPDRYPGAGPLGGLVTALTEAAGDRVAVLACDLIAPDASAVSAVMGALEANAGADAALAFAGGRRQWAHGAWRRGVAGELTAAFAAGERAIHRAAAGLQVVEVHGLDPRALADADTPEQLPDRSR